MPSLLLLSSFLSSLSCVLLSCLHGGCRHLRLLSANFLFRFNLPVLRALLKRVGSDCKAALSDSVPCLTILEWRTCFDQVDSSHCVGFALLFSKTYWTLVFRYSIPRSKEFGSSRCSPGQASIRLKIGLQCRLKSLRICFGSMSLTGSTS